MFSLQQNQGTRGWNRFYLEARVGSGGLAKGDIHWSPMYAHVSKCKNDKIK
jgi:hypothetical protein